MTGGRGRGRGGGGERAGKVWGTGEVGGGGRGEGSRGVGDGVVQGREQKLLKRFSSWSRKNFGKSFSESVILLKRIPLQNLV